jgi:alpha-L-rhamnosidase
MDGQFCPFGGTVLARMRWAMTWARVGVAILVTALLAPACTITGASATVAAGRPGPPRALTVDGDRAPVGVDPDDVEFAWHVSVRRAGAGQGAYRILVSTRPDRTPPDRSVVWDSGVVASAQQAFVGYRGPRLAADQAYWWSVATADASGRFGAFAPAQRFVTGLRDGDWRAQWLRPGPPGPVPEEYTYVRHDARLSASPIVRAVLYVAAAHHDDVHINGVHADTGNAFAYPDELYYQATDVTALVRAGRVNSIGVLHHWYGAGQGRPAAIPGLLVELSVLHRDGRRELITSDGTWKQHAAEWLPAPPRNDEGDFVERVDGRLSPLGWDRPGFDDRSWAATPVLGPAGTPPFTHLVASRTRIGEQAVPPVSVRALPDGSVVADFGAVIAARPAVTFRAGRSGRVVGLHVGFLLDADGHVSTTRGTQGTDLHDEYIERAGRQTFEPLTYLGFRYLEVTRPGEPIRASDLTAFARHTVLPDDGATFTSSDPFLDRVFALTERSAAFSAQEQFVDTPTREKGQFLADAFNESQATMGAFGEQDLSWQALRDFARSQARYWPDGRVNAVYPNGDGARDIPDYTELYPEWVWQYYLATGDRATLAALYPVVARIDDYLARSVDPHTGLVTRLPGGSGDYEFGIVDWPPAMRYGYDVATAARTTVNVLAVNAYARTAQMAEVLGRGLDAGPATTRARALTAAINARLTRPDGVYVDGLEADGTGSAHASQQANALALAFGIVPPSRTGSVGAYVAGLGIALGPMNGLSLLRALHVAGRDADVVRVLDDRTDPGWGHILASGGTFTWESWTPIDLEGDSMSHGWGSSALVAFQEALLGVTRVAAGADGGPAVAVQQPNDGLASARGTVPTIAGPLSIAWTRTHGRTTLHLVVPPNLRVSLRTGESPSHVRRLGAGTFTIELISH